MSPYRILVIVFSVLLATFSQAASVAQRSPLTQGMWWDPSRSGHGFEIFQIADQIGMAWFTYDENSRPIWYTAQGDVASLGKQSWPLLQHRWANGTKEGYSVVGSLRLDVTHPESADVTWELRSQKGKWEIRPFAASGIINEIDHSGLWFDPDNGGWGLTITEQGDLRGGVLFTYNSTGEPVWAVGLERSTDGVSFSSFVGACPYCTYRAGTSSSVGRLSYNFLNEAEMTLRNLLSLPMAAGVKLDNARLVQLSRPASARAADRQLAHFDSDAALKTYLDAGMINIPATSMGIVFSAGPPSVPYSTTNLQESGVDEADLVKSDGRNIYTFAYDNNVRKPAIVVAQTAEGETLDVLGAVALDSGASTSVANAGLFLHGNNLVSVTGTTPISSGPFPIWSTPYSWSAGKTHVEILNTSNPGLPVRRWRAQLDGSPVTSRRIGQRLYVVSRFVPHLPGFFSASAADKRQMLASTPLAALLPQVNINGGNAAAAIAARDVYLPPQGSQKAMADMILITAIDLDEARIVQTLGIIGAVDTVYASSAHLFLATTRYQWASLAGISVTQEPFFTETDIHQIRLGTDKLRIVGSGAIEGYLGGDVDKAAFRLSEFEGRLRAVSSSSAMWGAANKNRLTILEPSTVTPGLLKTVAYLPNAQRPETLGKPDEQLYGTRFVGDRLYAVTFKKIDPLYVVDLSNSADPRITGQLEIPGFSDYLHPLPNGLLLGFGKYARPANVSGDGQFAWFQGLQLSLFDVSNVKQPREIQTEVIGKRGSESALLRNHHAFSALMRPDGSGSIAIPARIHEGAVPQYGSDDSAYYPWAYSGLLRFELRGATPADARLVQAPTLVSHSAQQQAVPYFNDPGSDGGRSVLFPKGTIYVGNGQFWRQDMTGKTFGPF